MADIKCDESMCENKSSVHFTLIEERNPVELKHRCHLHADEVYNFYCDKPAKTCFFSCDLNGAAQFDLNFMYYDEAPGAEQDGPCTIYMKEVEGARRFAFKTGYFESWGLDTALKRGSSPRPLTYQLMAHIIDLLGAILQYVLIDKYEENPPVFHTELKFLQRQQSLVLDARPSDAIILAVICNVPIFIAEEVLCKFKQHG